MAAIAPLRQIVLGHEVHALDTGWEVAPGGGPSADRIPARVPGTVAGAYRDAGRPLPAGLDDGEWSFRTRFEAAPAGSGEEIVLRLDGIATIADVLLDGVTVATNESMFLGQVVDITHLVGGSHELEIRCRPLAPLLAGSRRPRARWRTALVSDGNLRWFRTSLLGRAPGFSAGPPIVGPWRPVSIERRRGLVVEDLRVRAALDGDVGRLDVEGCLRSLRPDVPDHVVLELDGPSGRHEATIEVSAADGSHRFEGVMHVPDVATWWPHTHGTPALHSVLVRVESGGSTMTVDSGRVGFRSLAAGSSPDHDVARDGLDLHVNGVRVFARGAVWTPVDPVGIAVPDAELRASLEMVVAAGMNMLRVPGIGLYESHAFHALCDELGILVWQDLMFANLDYPFVDDAFRGLAEREAAQVVGGLASRPSTAVVCGNSEVEQQVAMLGLDPELGRDAFYGETLPAVVARAGSDAVVVPSTPFGGDLPFRPDRGIANYYGVGGYRRPLSDARTAGVRFAGECLAFSNLPDAATLDGSAGVPRDNGAAWDFADVRDHYLGSLHGVDPVTLRRDDPERYLALSRAVTGEVMAEVFGEWRRAASPCGGGLVLWWRDVVLGAGWGLLDRDGRPKVALHHLRRALAPVAVWMTDEGLGGIAVHVANDRPASLSARLRLALYRDGEIPVGDISVLMDLSGQTTVERNVETLLGRFVDASWAYRFGPPAQDLVVASLEAVDGDPAEPLSQAVRFPAGRPSSIETASALGLAADAVGDVGDVGEVGDGVTVEIQARKLVYGVRLEAPGWVPEDDAFSIEPGHARRIPLRPALPGTPFRGGRLTAINLLGAQEIAVR
jgi:beta-mannosidase